MWNISNSPVSALAVFVSPVSGSTVFGELMQAGGFMNVDPSSKIIAGGFMNVDPSSKIIGLFAHEMHCAGRLKQHEQRVGKFPQTNFVAISSMPPLCLFVTFLLILVVGII